MDIWSSPETTETTQPENYQTWKFPQFPDWSLGFRQDKYFRTGQTGWLFVIAHLWQLSQQRKTQRWISKERHSADTRLCDLFRSSRSSQVTFFTTFPKSCLRTPNLRTCSAPSISDMIGLAKERLHIMDLHSVVSWESSKFPRDIFNCFLMFFFKKCSYHFQLLE